MDTANLIEVQRNKESVEVESSSKPLGIWSAFASMAAFFCLVAEIILLEHIDSLSLYLTYSEIAIIAGIVLVMEVCAAFGCWLGILFIVQTASLMPSVKRHKNVLASHIGLGIGFCYFVFEMIGAGKLLVPAWKPSIVVRFLIVGGVCISLLVIFRVRSHHLQRFARTRLVPISLVHFALAGMILVLLFSDHTHLFRDYANPGHSWGPRLPDIYLITMDALSAEDTSLYGYERRTTPNLERFARRSFTFDYLFANSNFTTPSIASIATGKLPWSHRVFHFSGFLRGEATSENLAALLRQHGYYTATISANYAATPILQRTLPSYDAVGFVRPEGFEGWWFRLTNFVGSEHQYILDAALPNRGGAVPFISYLDALIWPFRYPSPAETAFEQARALLERSDITQPRFLWVHILPPHDPYLPPSAYRNRFLAAKGSLSYSYFLRLHREATLPEVSSADFRDCYDEMVLYADHEVGQFLDWLDQTGRLDRAIVIVSADHGESFEHRHVFHGGPNLDEGVIHIPLLIHLPGQQRAAHVTQLAQQSDLLPTVIDLIGGEVPKWTDGTSLKPALEGKVLPERYVFSMNLEPDRIFDPIAKGTLAVFDDEFKYVIRLGTREEWLYRYKTDQLEKHNLITSEPDAARRLHDVLLYKLKEVNERFALKPRKDGGEG
jgi:arylsulfatase A-like enzyme